MGADLFTLIPVSYRDASGWQQNATYVAEGAINKAQTRRLRECVDGDGFFIPTQIGFEHLGAAMEKFPSEDDHIFHVMDVYAMEIADTLPGHNMQVMVGPVDEFVDRMVTEHARGWDDTVDVNDL